MVIKVTLLYDPVWSPLSWIKTNCPSYITNKMHQDGSNAFIKTKIDYFFSDAEDAAMFALTWA